MTMFASRHDFFGSLRSLPGLAPLWFLRSFAFVMPSILVGTLLVGCSAKDPDLTAPPDVPEIELLDSAMSAYDRELYQVSRENWTKLREGYPLSAYAVLADLKIADSYFFGSDFAPAVTAYQEFIKNHPAHEAAPYALFQAGNSFRSQYKDEAHESAPLQSAIEQFLKVKELYPSSEFAVLSVRRARECKESLAKHEEFVADFYERRGSTKAAETRRQAVAKIRSELARESKGLPTAGKTAVGAIAAKTAESPVAKLAKAPATTPVVMSATEIPLATTAAAEANTIAPGPVRGVVATTSKRSKPQVPHLVAAREMVTKSILGSPVLLAARSIEDSTTKAAPIKSVPPQPLLVSATLNSAPAAKQPKQLTPSLPKAPVALSAEILPTQAGAKVAAATSGRVPAQGARSKMLSPPVTPDSSTAPRQKLLRSVNCESEQDSLAVVARFSEPVRVSSLERNAQNELVLLVSPVFRKNQSETVASYELGGKQLLNCELGKLAVVAETMRDTKAGSAVTRFSIRLSPTDVHQVVVDENSRSLAVLVRRPGGQ